jgi:adenylosuccinate lyase
MQDGNPTSRRVPDPGVRDLYKLSSRWQAWLDVESALALAQAEQGMIPQAAARAIAEAAHLELFDESRVTEGMRRTSHMIVPLVWELARVAGAEAGGWVHWGATTQNIVQTGDMLTLRRAHRTFLGLIGEALTSMADLAERTHDMPMPARTHGQHAVPATFGFKVAGWIDEMVRHAERLRAVEQRVFVAMLGGAAGTFASMGARGPAVQAGLAARLGLAPMVRPIRSIGDHLAEYICLLGLLATTCGKIGREIFTLSKTEFGEVEEPIPPGTVGSSTMPHKRNPFLCQDIVADAAGVRAIVPLALEAAQTEHEGDRANSLMMREATERACVATGDMLSRLVVVCSGLQVNREKMLRNLGLTGGLIVSEAVMLKLGDIVGRQVAHDMVYDAAQAAISDGESFAAILNKDERMEAHLSPEAIDELLDPTHYLGLCSSIALAGAGEARVTANALLALDEEPETRRGSR